MIRVDREIGGIDAGEWDRLFDADAFASVGWLTTVETHYRGGLEPRYITAWRGERLIGASVCYLMRRSDEIETLDDLAFGRLKGQANRLGATFLPCLACGTVLGHGRGITVGPELSDSEQAETIQTVLDAFEREAVEAEVRPAFIHLLAPHSRLTELLKGRGYLESAEAPVAVLDVHWNSYDDYLTSLPARRRKSFRHQSNRFRRTGGETERVTDPGPLEADMESLADSNSRKHNHRAFPFRPGYLSALAGNLRAAARIFRSSGGDQTTGMCLSIATGREYFAATVGVAEGRNDFTYFELCFPALIKDAIALGAERIWYGRALYKVKVRRGCRLAQPSGYYKPRPLFRPAARAWLALLSRWNRRHLQSGNEGVRSQEGRRDEPSPLRG